MSPDTKKGFRFEKDVTKALYSEFVDRGLTTQYRLIPSGWSGNHNIPSGDLDIVGPQYNYTLELKNTNDETGFRIGGGEEGSDIDQLSDCAYNVHTRSWVVLSFKNRETTVFELDDPQNPQQSLVDNCPSAFNPRSTRTGNVLVDKPSLDDWSSARSGCSDVNVLIEALDIGTETFNIDVAMEAST